MPKFFAALLWSLKAIGFSLVVAVVVAAAFHRAAIDLIYKNVEDTVDGEMPPTVVSFPSGPEVVSIIGGSGAGLNCSLPRWTNAFFGVGEDSTRKKRLLVLQRFRQACVFHDLCYRHGLATYGYSQNDCDRVLQNQAFRLCLYIRSDGAPKESGADEAVHRAHEAANCQADSKKVLAGVSLGGFNAYRGWDYSTYFEFESDPSRSNGFSAARVVRHPFKSAVSPKYDDASDEVILTFVNSRSNLTVKCLTCKDETIQKSTRIPEQASDELKSVGIDTVPQALLTHELKLNAINPIWLPPRRRHAAPHLLVDNAGKNHLIWMSRNNNENSIFCVVLSDAAKLLTYTLPRFHYCGPGALSRLTMVEPDMFATSPLPMEILAGDDRIFTTSLSAQTAEQHGLSFCTRSASRPIKYHDKKKNEKNEKDDQAKCEDLRDERFARGAGLGAFQNFAVVRPGQQIFFARDIWLSSPSFLTRVWQNWLGETYSPGGVMLVFDVASPAGLYKPALPTIRKPTSFNIPDRLDPMMPITRKNDDLRFLSLEAPEKLSELNAAKSLLKVHLIDFAKDNPAIGDVQLSMNGSGNNADAVQLHASWALRPVLVLETKGPNPKTKLVFSRGMIAKQAGKFVHPSTNFERLQLETAVFERDASSASDKPFALAGSASCKVSYTFSPNPDYPCRRAFDPDRTMRPSPAAKMQASQLLVGHFAGHDGHGIAFPDACLKNNPIILRPKVGSQGEYELVSKDPAGDKSDVERNVECGPVDKKDYAAPLIPK